MLGDNPAVPADVLDDLDAPGRLFVSPLVKDTGRGTLPIVVMGCYEWRGMPYVLRRE